MSNSPISNDEAKKLVERWSKSDETLSLAERVFVLEKMVKRLLFLSKRNTK